MASEREVGFYWVKSLPDYGDQWMTAYWGIHPFEREADYEVAPPREWWTAADKLAGADSDFAEIGERIVHEPSIDQALDIFRLSVLRSVIRRHLDSPEFRAEFDGYMEKIKMVLDAK